MFSLLGLPLISNFRFFLTGLPPFDTVKQGQDSSVVSSCITQDSWLLLHLFAWPSPALSLSDSSCYKLLEGRFHRSLLPHQVQRLMRGYLDMHHYFCCVCNPLACCHTLCTCFLCASCEAPYCQEKIINR